MELNVLVMGIIIINIARLVQGANPTPNPTTTTTTTTTTTPTVNRQPKCIIPITSSGQGGNNGVPTSFTYACALNGTIHIDINSFKGHDAFRIRGIEPSPNVMPIGHCKNFTCTINSTHVNVTGCPHDTPILLDFDKMNDIQNDTVIGGKSSKRFQLGCSSSFIANITYTLVPSTLSPQFTQATVTYMPALMTIKLTKGGQGVTSALVGETLKLEISITEPTYKIKPTLCVATNGKEDDTKRTLKLWSEQGTSHSADKEVFGETWNFTNDGKTVRADVYAFRFVDTDVVFITCNVRMCLKEGKNKAMCEKNYTSKRRRRSDFTQVKLKRVSTKIHVYDIQTNKASGQTDFVHVLAMVAVLAFAGGRFLT